MKLSTDPRILNGLAALGAAVFFLFSWLSGYSPALNAYKKDQNRVKELKWEIMQVESLMTGFNTEKEWITEHRLRFAKLRGRFPSQSELPELLDALAERFASSDVKLAGMQQGNLEPLIGLNGQQVLIDNDLGMRFPVTVSAEGRYHAVLALLDSIMREDFPCVVGLDQIQMKSSSQTGSQLGVSMQLSLYVIRPQELQDAPDA